MAKKPVVQIEPNAQYSVFVQNKCEAAGVPLRPGMTVQMRGDVVAGLGDAVEVLSVIAEPPLDAPETEQG